MRRFTFAIVAVIALSLCAQAQAAPTARYTYTPASPVTRQPVSFDASSSSCDLAPCTYSWRDDGPNGPASPNWSLGSGVRLTFTFNLAGNKYVRLTVRNSRGERSSTVKTIRVASGSPPPPPPPPAACVNGQDDDRDGLTDYPADPGCSSLADNDETNAPAPPPPPTGDQFPNPASTGVPAGWQPAQTRSTSLTVTQSGAVVQDILFTNGANLNVAADNVTIRRVKLEGGIIENDVNGRCNNGMLVEDTTITPVAGQTSDPVDHYALGTGGYTARRIEMHDRSDGLRVGGKPDCGPVQVEDSFINVKCPTESFHTDGIQAYGGDRLTMRNNTIDYEGGCGTSPFFYPDQGNTSAAIDRLLLVGRAGIMFRLGVPGSVRDLRIEDRSWAYAPIDNACEVISPWQANIVQDPVPRGENGYRSTQVVRAQPCNTFGGGN